MAGANAAMSRERLLRGVVCAAATPLSASMPEPDAAAVVEHCARLLRSGCDGINLLGTTGEATSLSVAQRLRVMEAIADSGLPLERFMVGTGAAALADAVDLTRRAVGLGYAGALVLPPFYFKPIGERGVADFYHRLVNAVADERLRVYFYHFPQLTGVPVAEATIEELVGAYPNAFVGLKDSSGDLDFARTVARRFPSLDVFPSSEAVLATARADGFAGCISASANVTAPIAARVWAGDASAAGDLATLRRVFERFPMIPAVRSALALVSGDERWERPMPPLEPLAAADRTALYESVQSVGSFATLRTPFAP